MIGNLQVKNMQELRRKIPEEGAHMYVVKNNLLKIAAGEERPAGSQPVKVVAFD